MSNLREILLSAHETGTLLLTVGGNLGSDANERGELAAELAALHNEGLVDVVAAFEALENSSAGPDFFLTRHVLEKALSSINAPVPAVMRCVHRLYKSAGQDLAAGTILDGFIEFCTKDETRPQAALNEIEADPAAFIDLLPAAIAAGTRIDNQHYLNETIRLSLNANIEIRRRAVFSFGRVHWKKDEKVPEPSFVALERSVEIESDDEILASVVRSAFAFFQQDKSYEGRAIAIVSSALLKGSDRALHAGASLLGFQTNDLPPALLDLLLAQLKRVKPENKGTLDFIDYGLARLLKGDQPEIAIQFIEDMLLAHPETLRLDVFDSAVHAVQENAALLNKVVTRWLLNGARVLCAGVAEIGGARRIENELCIDIDPNELKPSDSAYILFVARKAIGYFFMNPITAASIVISLMRIATDDEALEELGDLLADPLLVNYTGKMRTYVQQQVEHESGRTKATIEGALTRIQDYLNVLNEVPTLLALHPSESQHNAYRRHMSETMATSFKAAQKNSIFLNLFSRSTLLYGDKSINYIYGPDGKPHRTEMPLGSHGVTVEFPRMDNIDPVGTDYMMRVFRIERIRT